MGQRIVGVPIEISVGRGSRSVRRRNEAAAKTGQPLYGGTLTILLRCLRPGYFGGQWRAIVYFLFNMPRRAVGWHLVAALESRLRLWIRISVFQHLRPFQPFLAELLQISGFSATWLRRAIFVVSIKQRRAGVRRSGVAMGRADRLAGLRPCVYHPLNLYGRQPMESMVFGGCRSVQDWCIRLIVRPLGRGAAVSQLG